jgi:hypothetical protein
VPHGLTPPENEVLARAELLLTRSSDHLTRPVPGSEALDGDTVLAVSLIIGFSGLATAQSPEVARVLRGGDEATLSVFGGRPVDLAAKTLVDEFGIQVNGEDPLYFDRDDVEDVTAQVSRVPNPQRRTIVPRGRLLEIAFGLRSDGFPADVPALLQTLVEAANAQAPFGYRLDRDGDTFSLVPTRTHDAQGHVVDVTPTLDRRISIPFGTRPIFEHVSLLTHALEEQTGVHIGCCQAAVTGIPWGSTVVSFEARDEPARSALLRLVRSEPGHYYWLMRCQAGDLWCFINVARIPDKR